MQKSGAPAGSGDAEGDAALPCAYLVSRKRGKARGRKRTDKAAKHGGEQEEVPVRVSLRAGSSLPRAVQLPRAMSSLRQRKKGCGVRPETPPGTAAAHRAETEPAGGGVGGDAASRGQRLSRQRSPISLRGVLGGSRSGGHPGVVERQPRARRRERSSSDSSESGSRLGEHGTPQSRRVRSDIIGAQLERGAMPRSRSDVGRLPYR